MLIFRQSGLNRCRLIINVLRNVLILCLIAQSKTQAQESPKITYISSELPLSINILYFDQRSALLRPGVRNTLDSVARVLINQPRLLATLTGYTDPIGNREKNVALAEQRAKAVERYLKQRGVAANQIITQWEGPDENASTRTDQGLQTISRRVILQLSPK